MQSDSVLTTITDRLAINDLFVRSGWHPAVGVTLPLSQAAYAHQLQQDNTLDKKGTLAGKIVLIPGS